MNKNTLATILMVTGGTGAGVAAGFFFAKNKYEKLANEEISQVKDYYRTVHKQDHTSIVEDMEDGWNGVTLEQLEALRAKLEDRDYVTESEVAPDQVTLAIFDTPDLTEELELLNKLHSERNAEDPYLITVSEWSEASQLGQDQNTITYYEGDDILVAEDESVLHDVAYVVGENLSFFGVGSEDSNIVYVRNQKAGVDFEVIKDPRSWSDVMHGITDWHAKDVELPKRVLKLRRGDGRDD